MALVFWVQGLDLVCFNSEAFRFGGFGLMKQSSNWQSYPPEHNAKGGGDSSSTAREHFSRFVHELSQFSQSPHGSQGHA